MKEYILVFTSDWIGTDSATSKTFKGTYICSLVVGGETNVR